jgi:hypothetical protein
MTEIQAYNLVSAEHDIFGEAVSDSEEEETNINILELEDETSRPSADDSRLSDSTSLQVSGFEGDSEKLAGLILYRLFIRSCCADGSQIIRQGYLNCSGYIVLSDMRCGIQIILVVLSSGMPSLL